MQEITDYIQDLEKRESILWNDSIDLCVSVGGEMKPLEDRL